MTDPKNSLSVRHKFFFLLTLTLISMFDLVDRRSSPKLFEHQYLAESSTGRGQPLTNESLSSCWFQLESWSKSSN